MMRGWLLRVLSLPLLAMFGLAACGGEPWQTKDISGLMPPLELSLSGTGSAPLTEAHLRQRTTLLFFGFTSCPDVCPGTLTKLTALRRQLPESLAEAVRIVFVSVDPARDDPQRLAEYAAHFGAGVIAATGTPEELRALARRYRTTYSYGEPDAHGHYEVSHSAGVYVFDAQGNARLLFRGSDSLEAMRTDLLRLMQGGYSSVSM